jgi:hypothetical protein
MSKIKSPQKKKELSLDKDRRNLFGECPISSRRSIRRGKQRSHRGLRRVASEELLRLRGSADVSVADEVEARVKPKLIAAKRSAFKKKPDKTLREAIAWKGKWRSERSGDR